MGGTESSEQQHNGGSRENARHNTTPRRSSRSSRRSATSASAESLALDMDQDIVLQNVKTLWQKVEPHKKQIGKELYERLFSDHIEYRMLFRNTSLTDMPEKLMDMIGTTVEAGSFDKMTLRLCALGRLHAQKSVPFEAFDIFAKELVKSMRSVLGENGQRLDDEEVAQFLTLYSIMSQLIRENMETKTKLDLSSSSISEQHKQLMEDEDKDSNPDSDSMSINEAVEIFNRFWKEKVEQAGRTHKVGRNFYTVFFSSHPEYRSLFRGDMGRQANILMRMLSMFSAQGIEKFSTHYDQIVAKHTKLGLTRKHFSHFGQSLIVTLKMELGSEFSADDVKAFRQVYRLLAMPMEVAMEHAYIDMKKRPRAGQKPRPTLKSSMSGARDGFI